MIHKNIDEGLSAVMFPVREVPVLAETQAGRQDLVPGKKALVNGNTLKVLSVVGQRYQVLHNRTALTLARKCCLAAFPMTEPTNWQVFSVEASTTGGHCRIDLRHLGEISGYDWSLSGDATDKYAPFIRVSNSYNRTRAFGIRFGLVRWACTNGLIHWRSSIKITVAHNVQQMEESIEAKINESRFRKLHAESSRTMKVLRSVNVSRWRFRPVMQSVLRIRRPEDLTPRREQAWHDLEVILDRVADKYAKEIGENGYALMNAVTDLATHPPTDTRGYSFIRRERDTLQRLAGAWIESFMKIASAYLHNSA